jgi:hypothetical protein
MRESDFGSVYTISGGCEAPDAAQLEEIIEYSGISMVN